MEVPGGAPEAARREGWTLAGGWGELPQLLFHITRLTHAERKKNSFAVTYCKEIMWKTRLLPGGALCQTRPAGKRTRDPRAGCVRRSPRWWIFSEPRFTQAHSRFRHGETINIPLIGDLSGDPVRSVGLALGHCLAIGEALPWGPHLRITHQWRCRILQVADLTL